MSKELVKSPQNMAEFLYNMKDSFNNTNIYKGDAKDINNHNIYNFNFTKETTNVKSDDLPIIVDQIDILEVFPNDDKIIKLIWNNLSFQDKLDCTLVCKRFNKITSDLYCFSLVLEINSMVQIIPTLSRNYKTVIIRRYICKSLTSVMRQMLNHLSQSVIDLTLDCCQFDLIALCEFLRELPLLESLQMNVVLTMDTNIDLSVDILPNLLKLKDFKIKVNADKFNETLDITKSASNIQSLSLFHVILNNFNYLKQYKSLTSLSLTKCIIETPFNVSNLNSLLFDSSVKLPLVDFSIFNYLEKLRTLELNEVDNKLMRILEIECVNQLTEFKIVYNREQTFDVHYFFHAFIYANNYFADINSVDDSDKLIDVGYKWPISNKTFVNAKKRYGDVLVYDKLQEGQKRIEFNFNENDKTKNLNDYALMLSFKIISITTDDNEIRERKFRTFKRIIKSFPICKTHIDENTNEECDGTRTDCIVFHKLKENM